MHIKLSENQCFFHSVIVPFTFSASIDLLPFAICIVFDLIMLINTMLQSLFLPTQEKYRNTEFDVKCCAHKLYFVYLVVLIFTFLNIVKHILNHISPT